MNTTSESRGSTPESALSVKDVSRQLTSYLAALPRIWIEGQVVSARQYGRTVYITFRDPDVDMSLSVIASSDVVGGVEPAVAEGSRIVIQADVEWWTKKGDLHLRAHAIRAVGLGDLLARIEILRRMLEAEGLFREDRKKPIPFMPRRIGLITGRDTDALKDVVVNARRRWPAADFEIREIALQRADTPLLAAAALADLQKVPFVDVIIISRGGGSFEDLLPWSDEGLLRAVAASAVPIISAIGHEADRPLLDEVADLRASTPTDAARKVVPDLEEETARIDRLASRLRELQMRWIEQQRRSLHQSRSAIAARSPRSLIDLRRQELNHARKQIAAGLRFRLQSENSQLISRRHQLAALSPFAVLSRGYAVVTNLKGDVIRQPDEVKESEALNIRVEGGTFTTIKTNDITSTKTTTKTNSKTTKNQTPNEEQ